MLRNEQIDKKFTKKSEINPGC